MANLLQSAQVKATCAPEYYTNYLTNLATKGAAAQQQAQFVGAQPLQQAAFTAACASRGQFQPGMTSAQGYIDQSAGKNITGAASPYLEAATSVSPLCAARPMICQAVGLNIADVAGDYMNPYIKNAVQSMSDIAQRNIRQNLSPLATAAAVGSGQFGSQRGAQVLGQVEANAQQDLNNQIAQMLSGGFGQSLQAATAKQNALTAAAQQIAQAQQAGSQLELEAGKTAGNLTAQEAEMLRNAGLTKGTLAEKAQGMNLACINALATLGGQQQTIEQNRQNYPLTTLSSLASLLQGYSIPTATRTTMQMSPFSALGAIGSAGLGLLTPRYNTAGQAISGSSPLDVIKAAISGIRGGSSNTGTGTGLEGLSCANVGRDEQAAIDYWLSNFNQNGGGGFTFDCIGFADGGSIHKKAVGGKVGCASTRSYGALPYKKG